MKREEFIEKINMKEDPGDAIFERSKRLIIKSNELSNTIHDIGIVHNLVIAIEELSELSQAVSKYIRGNGDSVNLIEECADVMIALEYVKTNCDINDGDIRKAMSVKCDRLENNMADIMRKSR